MSADKSRARELIEKIRSVPAEQVAEVEDFVDFLRQREEERRLARAVSGASEATFAQVWDNPDDAEYDRLLTARPDVATSEMLERKT
jgi:hypothetical protein